MTNYIKAITTAATEAVAEDYVLIPVDGVNAITFGGTPGTSHILNIYYMISSGAHGDTDANGRQFLVNVTIPDANLTTAANIRRFFYSAMSASLQGPGSLPLLFNPGPNGDQELVTSLAAASAAL